MFVNCDCRLIDSGSLRRGAPYPSRSTPDQSKRVFHPNFAFDNLTVQASARVVSPCSLKIFVIAELAVASVKRFDDILTHSLDDARRDGWMYEEDDDTSASFGDLISLYDFKRVHWSVLPTIAPVWAAMVIIVAFSSCLHRRVAVPVNQGTPGALNKSGSSSSIK